MHSGESSSKRTIEQVIGEQPATSEFPIAVAQNYLWAVGLEPTMCNPGMLLSDRYMVHDSQIVSDTKMYKLPDCTEQFSMVVSTYLKLSCFSLHCPRPYAVILPPTSETVQTEAPEFDSEDNQILLLENAPILPNGKLMPTLAESWSQAAATRQVNWLWQILYLWQPLTEFRVASTFLNQKLVRVDGCWIKILQLQTEHEPIQFTQLGELWTTWLDQAKPEIEESLAELFYAMSRGAIDCNRAIAYLDQLNAQLVQAQPLATKVATATDPGTRRSHNEDSCYPRADQAADQIAKYLSDRLVIICDGLGGHEGGEIASKMAIDSLEHQLEPLLRQVESASMLFSASSFISQLDAIVRVVNDQIVALNDSQYRQAQQRMGTTLVMAVIPRPQAQLINQVFIVNVGDSRLYWINARNCYQATIDDDVASRDVLLGYNLPAYSAQRIDAGSLTQALGTRESGSLIPTIQRFLIDEACVLLLCSDGLSDYERVPELWRSLVLPLLIGSQKIEKACQNLIEQGNQRNGHDNITVGLIQCQLVSSDQAIAAIEKPILANTEAPTEQQPKVEEITEIQDKTEFQILEPEKNNHSLAANNPKLLIGMIMLIAALGLGVVYKVLSQGQQSVIDSVPTNPTKTTP